MSFDRDPRICIVGAGALSTRRIYPYIGAAGGQLVGICDLDAAKAERNSRRFGGRVYSDVEQMLKAETPDGVIICVGPRGHAQLAQLVLGLGYPVYTEKPPSANAADALAVARKAKATGLLCVTAFKKRYNEAYTRAKQFIDARPADDLYSLSIDYCSKQYSHETLERTFLFDFCVHVIDLAGFLFGDVAEVFAFNKGKDAYAVSVRFANGAVGSFNFADGRSFQIPTEEVEITARGGNFMTVHNSSVWKITENEKCTEWREPPTFTSSGDSGNDTGHLAEIVDFFSALKEGRKTSRSSIYDSYKTMVVYEAIAQSAEMGAVVKVKYETV